MKLIVILIYFIIALIVFNIAPFILSDTFGHYLVPIHYIYVYGEETPMTIMLYAERRFETREEKCNPWLMWWQEITGLQLVKMKPNETHYTYQDERIERLWKQATYDEDRIPCSISIIKLEGGGLDAY